MSEGNRARLSFTIAIVAVIATFGIRVSAQDNPYRVVEGWAKLPEGRSWGSTAAVDVDSNDHIWVAERCGTNSCAGSNLSPILEFDPSGKLLRSFGAGMFVFPHGICVDKEGNVWVTDGDGKDGKGHQVFKFSPDGRVLMTLGKKGVKGNGPDTFDQPTGIAVAPNGDIFVTDGHGKNDRVVKFSKDGKFIKTWGRHGAGPGEFDQPHDISIGGSQNRVYIADRSNNRVQIFDQDGSFIAAWKQFGRPSAVFIAKDDTLYVSDSHSNSTVNPGYTRGITVGSAKDGSIKYFTPDPDLAQAEVNRISGASGIVADAKGTIYAADVGPHKLRKYVLK